MSSIGTGFAILSQQNFEEQETPEPGCRDDGQIYSTLLQNV
jgi:hypothetical protein